MSSSGRARHLKMPRLRMRDDLLQADPTLAPLLDDDGQASVSAPKVEGRHMLDTSLYDEELPEAEELNLELERVKKERAALLKSLAALKADQGKSGADMQNEDIKILRNELAMKKEKLNELHQESGRIKEEVTQLELTSRDCAALMPTGQPMATAKIKTLADDKASRDAELVDSEAKNQMYTLLALRTRKEHEALAHQVARARAMREGFAEDLMAMAGHAADVRAARETADSGLTTARAQFDGTRSDWKRKLTDRRKKVGDIEKRRRDEDDREARRVQQAADKEAADRSKQATLHKQELAFEHQMLELQPQLEALEVQWFRLHTLTGADTSEDVVNFWQELQAQEGQMRELVRLAEEREGSAKAAMAALLESRSSVLQDAANQEAPPEEPSRPNTPQVDNEASNGSHERMAEANRRAGTADKNYAKLRSVCVGARQGLMSVRARLDKALEEATAANRRVSGGASPQSPAARRLSRSTSSQKRVAGSRVSGTGGPAAAKRPSRASEDLRLAVPPPSDQAFFPELPSLLEEVTDRLQQLMKLDASLRAALADKAPQKGGPRPSVNAASLVRGLRRRSWTGPAWLGSITENGQVVPASLTMKRAKGKKREQAAQPDLSRIYGWHSESDDESDPETPAKDVQESILESDESTKVIDREFLKHRATKLAMKHRQHDATAGGRGRMQAQVAAH